MLLAVVVPLGGPMVIDEPVALMVLPDPVARNPTSLADVAVVVAVVRSVLPSKVMVLPDWASAPVVVAPARFSVMPFAVIWPAAPDAFSPTAFVGVTVTVAPGDTVQEELVDTSGPGHTCAAAGDASQHPARAIVMERAERQLRCLASRYMTSPSDRSQVIRLGSRAFAPTGRQEKAIIPFK
jgi:hypothetical protein